MVTQNNISKIGGIGWFNTMSTCGVRSMCFVVFCEQAAAVDGITAAVTRAGESTSWRVECGGASCCSKYSPNVSFICYRPDLYFSWMVSRHLLTTRKLLQRNDQSAPRCVAANDR